MTNRKTRMAMRNQPVTLIKRLQNNASAIGLTLLVSVTGLGGISAVSALKDAIDPMGRAVAGYVIAQDRESHYSALTEEGWTDAEARRYMLGAENSTDGIFKIPQKDGNSLDRLGTTDRVVYESREDAKIIRDTEYSIQ